MLSQFLATGIKHVTPLGRTQARAWFSLDFAPFPFAHFALYRFTVKKSQPQELLSPPSESLNLREGLGDP